MKEILKFLKLFTAGISYLLLWVFIIIYAENNYGYYFSLGVVAVLTITSVGLVTYLYARNAENTATINEGAQFFDLKNLHKYLTLYGKQRLISIVLIFLCTLILFLIILTQSVEYADGAAFLFFLPLIYYSFMFSSLHTKLKSSVLDDLNFQKTSKSKLLDLFQVRNLGKLAINDSYKGDENLHPFNLINFQISTGFGRNKKISHFIGVEFETEKIHHPVQIYDNSNDLKPWFSKSHKLESNDFHKYFTVISKEPKHTFYQLDPDTMHDLMELRKNFGFGINIESSLNRILIYVKQSVFEREIRGILTFADVLNGEYSEQKKQLYRTRFQSFLDKLNKLYSVLDYELAKKQPVHK